MAKAKNSVIKKWFLGGARGIFIFFSLLIVIQLVFDFLWLPSPLRLIVAGLMLTAYLAFVPSFFYLSKYFKKSETEKAQVSAILFSISDAVFAYDRNFKIILFNPAAEELFQIKSSEIVGVTITPEMINHPQFSLLAKIIFPALAPSLLKMSLDKENARLELKFSEPKEMVLEVTTTKVIDTAGNHYGFLKIIRDRTREESILKMKSDFITIAAHQLRTPLAGINWSLDLVLNKELGALTEEQETVLKQAKAASQELIKDTEMLLHVSEIEEGRFGYKFVPTSIENLITETLIKYEPIAQSKNVKLIFYRAKEPLPSLTADPDRLKIVLEVLIDNAIKYNVKNGEVRIKINPLIDRPFLEIKVEDTGIGIPEAELSRLFTKFYRSSRSLKEQTTGLGLGLYLAKNIIKRHGGDLWAESVEDRGSVFHFTLPLDPSYIPPQTTITEEK
jgi:PAS domain S-box-containing protein